MRWTMCWIGLGMVAATLSMTACTPGTENAKSVPATRESTPAATNGHGGPVIELGSASVGTFSAKATRDQAEIVAGKDAPIDLTITPNVDATTKVATVRFWIGIEDASGSVKAKAEIEDPSEPNRWHTHAEIPDPLPSGSKLWVEIEDDAGGKHVVSFDLKS